MNFIRSVFSQNNKKDKQSDIKIDKYIFKSKCGEKKLVCKFPSIKDEDIKKCLEKPDIVGEGAFNRVCLINSNDQSKYALRLTLNDWSENNNETVDNEIKGLEYQALLSKTKEEGGLQCPYVAKVQSFGHINKMNGQFTKAYGLLEFLEGGDLYEFMKNINKKDLIKTFTVPKIKTIAVKILQTLNCIHKSGYVYLDLKPDNIMLAQKNNITDIKMVDFGLLKKIGSVGQVSGTPGYVSPLMLYEYFKESSVVMKYNFDIWSFGMILLELVIGSDFNKLMNIQGDIVDGVIEHKKGIEKYINGVFNFKNNFINIHTDDDKKNATDFINLIFDMKQNVSAEQLLRHSWLQDIEEDPLEPINIKEDIFGNIDLNNTNKEEQNINSGGKRKTKKLKKFKKQRKSKKHRKTNKK